MNRKRISDAISGISADFITECEAYAPKLSSGKERNMGRYEKTTKRRLITLALAACMVLTLGITAFAADIPSYIADWIRGMYVQTPTDEIRESRPDYAAWLDEQIETQAVLEEMAEKAEQVSVEKHPDGLPDATVTMLEYCYDGEKFTTACRYDSPSWPVTFDFDENHPLFDELEGSREGYWSGYENWTAYVSLESDRTEIQKRLAEDGHVGFTSYDFYVSDHVMVNGEDPGFSHTDPDDDDNGIFYVDPYYTSAMGTLLPESCQNLPELEVTFNVRCVVTHYWLEGDTVRWAAGERIDHPVSFTLTNCNQE